MAYPGVWLVSLAVAFAYWRFTRGTTTSRAALAGWLGVIMVEVALDWPIGPLAAGYLATAHAVQFLLIVLVAPPLLLIGARRGIEAWFLANSERTRRTVGAITHPLMAAIAFNVVIITTHVPGVNDALMRSQLGAFASDLSWLVGGVWFWWPIIVDAPPRPLFGVPFKLLYLFLGTLVHEGIAIVMLMREHPMYAVYELAPRATAMSALTDLEIAGGVMELGGAAIVFGILTVMFFRWTGGMGAERTARR